ncbi:MAG: hypothetical protein KDA38_12815 [Planctomycetales bacterium]|nr:hypothetical protein [Planctomycetales bacterium]
MKTTCRGLALIVGLLPLLTQAAEPAPTPRGPSSSIQIEMPSGDMEIAFIESNEGMVLVATCQGVKARAQRFYVGDGEFAVLFEASTDGFWTPHGKVNAAGITLESDSVISVPRNALTRWGAKRGELYLRTDSLKIVAAADGS